MVFLLVESQVRSPYSYYRQKLRWVKIFCLFYTKKGEKASEYDF
ncbi:hypothetical protein BREVNS_0625 [Brevinematales bacterium NS]|nr:hypothetical protein BREVNS_0625 [Brevinematales bacterium NS]